ncbi:MAG TPA: VWA domain-containing protein [Thermoanaerobaculaceae bacterium]|nr:VWA domain-containing protein [Thermoanaerobaculaceae bacterium]
MKAASVGFGAAVIAAVVGAGPAAAPQEKPRAPEPVAEAVRVNVVNVEVAVTGRDGRAVYDVRPEEFELREDGVVVPLTNFLAPIAPGAMPASGEAVRPTPASGARGPTEEAGRTLVVFVDDLNLTPRSRKPVLDNLRRFLAERTAEGYRVVLLSFNRTMQQHTPLTGDPKVLTDALDTLEHTAFAGLMIKAQRDALLRDMGRPLAQESGRAGDLDRQMLGTQAAFSAREQASLMNLLMDSLAKLVDSLAGVPGRKAVLYVSEGIPLDPGSDVLGEAAALSGQGQPDEDVTTSADLRRRLREVVHRANASRITFYTINSGPSSGREVSAEVAMNPGTDVDAADFFSRDPSLVALTVGTGGLRLPNADALPTMVTDMEALYSLGYSPSHYGDGRYHRLEVRVARAGASVRCREGYLDKTPEKREEDVTSAALFARGDDNPLGARVQLGTAEKQGRGRFLLPLTLFVPARSLVLLENGAVQEGQVSVAIAAAKAGGRRSEVARQTFPIRVPTQHAAAFLRHDVSFAFSLLIEPGDATISVTARDDSGHVESVVVVDIGAEPPKR